MKIPSSWADEVSRLFMDADLIVGYGTFNDIERLYESGVVLPDRDIYLDLAEAFLSSYETKTITYANRETAPIMAMTAPQLA